MAKITSPGKWPGGKSYLAQRIIELMPPRCLNWNKPAKNDPGYIHMVEPYFGMGAVLLANDPEGISEVANDLNSDLMDFWRCLQEPVEFKEFQRIVQAIPFSEPEWKARCGYDGEFTPGRVAKAVSFFVRCRQSLAGRMKSFTGITKTRVRRGMNNEVSAWLTSVEGLPEVHARLKRVLILCKPALEVIRGQDGPRTLFYVDCPYKHETRVTKKEYGELEMSDEAHAELLTTLAGIRGRFLLSGYRSKMYDDAARKHKWQRTDIEIPNHASQAKTKKVMTECVWRNY